MTTEQKLALAKGMLKPRLIEEKMLILLRQGKISKWFSGIGQEAISTGVTQALQADDFILPMHRNLGVFTNRNVSLKKLFCQFQGKLEGFTKGRDRSFHFGSIPHRIIGMISHLGPQMGVADGVALGAELRGERAVTAVFTGDGGTSEGDFHEAINVASVWNLPVIFVIESNYYGLSTPYYEQFKAEKLSDRAIGYGIKGYTIDGNKVEEVYGTISKLAAAMRENPAPVILECVTFRRRGHEEASGTKYVPKELMEKWEARDPVDNYLSELQNQGILSEELLQSWKEEIKAEVEEALEYAFSQPDVVPDRGEELADVYRAHQPESASPSPENSEMRLVDAVRDGLLEGMRKWKDTIIMGQDVAEYGGVFKVTEGFVEEFGKQRVRNTPICESAIVAAAVGLSAKGIKSVIEMQFADFVTSGFNNVVNNLAKTHYRWGLNVDAVVRMPTGAGVGAGPFHSQSNEAWFAHTPGLKVVYPAFPHDAKGLLLASLEDPNPVMFFEHKALYRSVRGDVPQGYYTEPIGKAKVVRNGNSATIISYGLGVHWALEYANAHPDQDIEVLDLRTLVPLDTDAIYESVQRTGKVMVLHEDTLFAGIGGEIASWISEHAFEYLDAPVMRCGSMETPVPFAHSLENQFLATSDFAQKMNLLIAY